MDHPKKKQQQQTTKTHSKNIIKMNKVNKQEISLKHNDVDLKCKQGIYIFFGTHILRKIQY